MPPPPAPLPFSFRADGWRLLALLAVAVGLHWWVIATTAVTAIDSVGFSRYALALQDHGFAVLKTEAHPPAYPAAVLAASELVRAWWPGLPLAERMMLAAQLAAAAAGVLVVFPAYWLGRLLFDRAAAFRSALLLQLLPVFATTTSDGLSDGPFLLCVCTALAAGAWANGRWWRYLLCGAAAGVAYLVRPEGVLVVPAVAAAVGLRWKELGGRRAVLGVGMVAVGFVLVGGPYMMAVGRFTNKPAFGEKPEGAETGRAAGGPLFAESLPPRSEGGKRVLDVAWLCLKEWLKVGHIGVAVYALVGFACLFRRVVREPRFWPPVLYACGHLAVLAALGWKQGYISERHLLPVAIVGVPFAVGGLPAWFAAWAKLPAVGPVFGWRGWPALTATALAASCLLVPPLFAKQLHDDRAGHKEAGKRLAAELAAEDPAGVVVIDHYQLAQYLSGRAVRAVPPDPPPDRQKVFYLVLEFKKQKNGEYMIDYPKFGSERHKAAADKYNHSPAGAKEVLYHWPENAPQEQALMKLVRVRPQ